VAQSQGLVAAREDVVKRSIMNTEQRYASTLQRLVDVMADLYVATIDHMKVAPPSDLSPGGERRWALRNMAQCALVQVLTAADAMGISLEEVREIVKEAANGALAVVNEARASRRGEAS
jgi:hypothetical protein